MGNSNSLCNDTAHQNNEKEELKIYEPWQDEKDERKYLKPAYYE
jgi:hypothetical protein